MPQPITKSIHLEYNPRALRKRPELCSRIVIIASHWANIEDSLARLFASATSIEPAVAAAMLGNIQSLMIRLQVIKTAVDVLVSNDAAAGFQDNLVPRLRKMSGVRNRLVHADWRVHDDYPEQLIHTRSLGNPEGTFFTYSLKDLEEIEGQMETLAIDVQEFDRDIQYGFLQRDPERRKRFWQVTVSRFDPLSPDQDQDLDP